MFTDAEVVKLGAIHTVDPMVLSVPAELRSLAAHADELIASAERAAGPAGYLREVDRSAVREKVAAGGGDWPGRTVAIFACAEAGLLEALPLPGQLRDRAVLGIRPHIRPLLAALHRWPEQYAQPDRRAGRL
jgi:hypothetical protein